MSSVQRRSSREPSQRPAAGPWRLRLRWLWSRLARPFVGMFDSRRAHRRQPAADETPHWHGSRTLIQAARYLSYAGALIVVVWVAGALVVVVSGNHRFMFGLDDRCNKASFSCETLAGFLVPVLLIALASAVFLLARLRRVRRPYERRAREKPQEVVQTAGRIIGDVVGRDQLCQVLIEDLRDPATRRPHVVVGGVGTGKTALLVRLTELLAQGGAVPVPVGLRNAQTRLDFKELARERFLAEAGGRLLAGTDAEKVWRHLLRNDQIVVLADGLEEALIDGDAERDRDNLIRLAIHRANDDGLPLVVASRPHDPLREMEAAIIDLEPLSEEAALEYVQRADRGPSERRLDWIVETADVVETPLYLQITRELHQAALTEYVSASRDGGRLDTRSVDRAELRLRLLDTWTGALVRGHLPSGLPLSRNDRQATIEHVSALACIGLREDRLIVRFDELEGTGGPLVEALREELRKLRSGFDIRLAASRAAALGLLEGRGDGVRFPHSVMQAYFGSRLIHVAMEDQQYRDDALRAPGRELLIALVMHSRAKVREARSNGAAGIRTGVEADGTGQPLQGVLAEAAHRRNDVKALDLYAAALEIDSVDEAPAHTGIARQLGVDWPSIVGRDDRTLEESKLNVVRRFGEAARTIVERRRRKEQGLTAAPAYLELYRISAAEPLYPVRLAVAQEIGAGGDEALTALRGVLGPQDPLVPPDEQAPRDPAEPGPVGVGGEPPGDDLPDEHPEHEECEWREKVTRAWLAPLLLGSASSDPARAAARKNLERWLRFVAATDRAPEEPDLRLSMEIALAQGFKHAANRRDQHPHAHSEARVYLVEQAREMLRGVTFWFTRLTLVHALCLWALSDGGQTRGRGRDADYRALVARWTARPGGGPEHPFVVEARNLAAWALETGQPERFIWIDESGILARVGSRPGSPGSRRKHNLWIPPSTGWTALHPRAQQLVADVLLLLNLAERGARPSARSARLRRTDRTELPPCLAGERTPLDPTRTVGTAASSLPGSHCKHGCPFELCPYPPKGEKSYRVELSEAFCRRQYALVSRAAVRRKTAPWQGALPGDLRRFWAQMGTGRAGSKPAASAASSEAAAAMADAAGRRRPRQRRRA
jgi:NACHT domain